MSTGGVDWIDHRTIPIMVARPLSSAARVAYRGEKLKVSMHEAFGAKIRVEISTVGLFSQDSPRPFL